MDQFKKVKYSLRFFITPLLIIFGFIFLISQVVAIALPRLSKTYSNINKSKENELRLKERLTALREYSKEARDDQSDIAYSVLPDRNPSSEAINQFKSGIG